jgi:hypothetical protein
MINDRSAGHSFAPGERVPDTGVYQCNHSNQHTGSKELVFESGKKFPLCGVCFWSVKYILVANCTADDVSPLRRKKNDANIQALSA